MHPYTSENVAAQADTRLRLENLLFLSSGYSDDRRMPTHAHAYAHFVFSLNGKITQVCRNRTDQFAPFSLVFLPMGEPHSTLFEEGVRAFQVVMEPKWVEKVRGSSASLDSPLRYENGVPTWTAMRLYREFQHRDNLSALMLEGLLLELVSVTSRCSPNSTESQSPRWLRQARDLLHDRFTESLTLDEIAAAVGVHPSHLMESFRHHYHCTLGDYVRRLRVEYATHLLSTSGLPTSRIALDAGFADQSHFCRTFKSHTGMTPGQYKKSCG